MRKEYQTEEYQEMINFIDNNIEEIIKEYEEKDEPRRIAQRTYETSSIRME